MAISSSVTFSCTSDSPLPVSLALASASSICFWIAGSLPYWSSAAFSRLYSLFACAIWLLILSSSSFNLLILSTFVLSASHLDFWIPNSSLRSESSFLKASRRSLLKLSVSFLRAASSISNCIILRCISSSSAGIESSSVLIIAHASSTRSIALSGRNLSVIYLSDNTAALTSAPSVILTPWNTSYLSLRPLNIDIVSSTVGSSTITGWKRRSRAASFSIY